jgi:hypothetical protein
MPARAEAYINTIYLQDLLISNITIGYFCAACKMRATCGHWVHVLFWHKHLLCLIRKYHIAVKAVLQESEIPVEQYLQ